MTMFYRSIFRSCVFIIGLCLFAQNNLSGQFFSTGEPPASVKWRQINTNRHQIVFPSYFEEEAQRMAAYLDTVYPFVSWSLGHEPRKIPVLLHSHNSRSNGMVIWAPARMEIYPVPPQRFASNDWLFTLAVHEQRHVVQVDKMNRGATRFLSFLLGQQAHGLSIGRIPFWFLEGDAVSTETALTSWGRGRQAAFEMPFRATLLRYDERFSYDKSMFGSYRDFVPDHYVYGYHMVAALREEYGTDLWKNALRYVAENPWNPAPFAQSLKRQTGRNLTELHDYVKDYLSLAWEDDESYGNATSTSSVNIRENGLYTNYRSVRLSGDTSLFALKTGIAQIDEFVQIFPDGKERVIHKPGYISSYSFSLSGGRLAWSEYRPDARWALRNYSVIKIYDTHTGTERTITNRTRYFSPSFAPDGLFLAVVETTENNRHYIVILDSVTGEVAERFPAREGFLSLLHPRFTPDGRYITSVAACSDGKSIVRLDLKTGEWETILPPAFRDITNPVAAGDKIFFHSDISGTDQIYALKTGSDSLFKLTEVPLGAFYPEVSRCGENLFFSNYTEKGYDIVKNSLKENRVIFEEDDFKRGVRFYEILALQEKGVINPAKIPDTIYSSEPFNRLRNIFNIHSWSPFYFDYDEIDFSGSPFYPGLTLLSQNILNTTNITLGYAYKNNNHMLHGNFVYRGWYPVIEIGFDYGGKPAVFQGHDTLGPGPVRGDQLNLRSVVSVPLNFTHNRYTSGFVPSLRMNYNNSYYHYTKEDEYRRGMITGEARLFAYRYLKLSRRDINPAWGQSVRFRHFGSLFDSENLGSITSIQAAFYFPGVMPHHSIVLRGALQSQRPEKYLLGSLVEFPRGYSAERTEKLQIVQADYTLPLAYPDYSIPSIIYLKRLRSNFFADFGKNHNRRFIEEQNRIVWERDPLFSFGLGINADLHLFRLPLPFDLGIRIAHVPSRNRTSAAFIFGMNMSAL